MVCQRGEQDAEDDRPRLAVLRCQRERKQLGLVADLGEGNDADGNQEGGHVSGSRPRQRAAAHCRFAQRAVCLAFGHAAIIALRISQHFARATPMAQYVYTMIRVGKIVPPKREILKNISFSFFPGAKIGVLGLNGSGKSTLLRIMAGLDKDIEGEAVPMPGLSIGFLPQEPQLDPAKTVKDEVEAGLGEVMQAKQKLEEIYAAYAEPDADFDKLSADQAKYEAIIATSGADVEHQMEIAADALRLPPWDAVDRQALRRREAPRGAVQAAAVQARHAAARRADQPPRCRERRLARAVPVALPGHRRRGHARSLLPRQRGRVDPRTRPRHGHPVEGQLQLVAGTEGRAARARGQVRGGAHQDDEERAGVGAPERQGPSGQEQGAIEALRRAVVLRVPDPQRDAGNLHPGGRAARQPGDRIQERQQGLRRPVADRQSQLVQFLPARSSASSAPMAPASRRCST